MLLLNLLPLKIQKLVIYQLSQEDIDIRRKIILIYLFSSIGFIFLLGFGIASLVNHNYLIGTTILIASIFSLINFLLFIKTSKLPRASHGVSIIIILVSLFLIINGGVENTGPLWTYSTIPLILFLQGHIKGLIILLIYLCCSILFMFIPSELHSYENYSNAFKIRFIASYAAFLMLSWVYEYTAHQTYQRWRKLTSLFAEQARTDVLTGISNRRDIMEKLEYENMRAERRQEQYTILLIDIDHFKSINDNYGHDAGDAILYEVANTIKNTLFQRDLIGRWGGEEFLVILPDTNNENAAAAAEKIRVSVQESLIKYGNEYINVSISIGLATSDTNYNPTDYIKAADNCLYQAKSSGRNCVVSHVLAN
ncbi:MAG TPA: GGDEF domain-containing protein [Gammaproteobacteria bacterium]